MKHLVSIQVTDLFGYLNHEITLERERGITILHGANGTGKTTILRAIDQLSRSVPQSLMQANFKIFKLVFEDDSSIVVRREDKQLALALYQGNKHVGTVNTKAIFSGDSSRRWIARMLDSARRDEISRTQQSLWDWDALAPTLGPDSVETLRRYEEALNVTNPLRAARGGNIPPWLDSFWKNFECTLIEEQRLFRVSEEQKRGPPLFKRVVEDYAGALRTKIKDALGSYAEHSQQLDRTFPRRVIEALESDPPDAAALSLRLEEIEKRRQELHSAGLIEKEAALTGFDAQKLSRGDVAKTLSVYAADTESKLKNFEDIYQRITMFEGLMNSHHLAHKTVRVSKDKGLEFTITDTGANLDPASLSSGEQHMLVLFYELIFGRFKPGHLILIDEPELSLHPAWQLRFIDDLERVRSINKVDFVLATHSPQIIGSNWMLARELSV